MEAIVSTHWLKEHLNDFHLIILEVRLAKPKSDISDYTLNSIHIPTARFFDLEKSFSDVHTELPHMLPEADNFTIAAQDLGISAKSQIVVYDDLGIYSSPRVWWMFKAMGFDNIAVLDGGLPDWVAAGYETVDKLDRCMIKGNFKAALQKHWVSNAPEVLASIEDEQSLIVDARSNGRFNGTSPEPRAGLRGGHIPTSKNLPFTLLLHESHYLKPSDLQSQFEAADVGDQSLIFSCGSGVTASILALAAYYVGYRKIKVYDGSWSEWGQLDGYPVNQND